MRREATWKRVQGDVFRRPEHPLIFSLLIGAGLQILCTLMVVSMYSMYDYYIDKGALVGIAVSALPWFASINGYAASRFYTFFNGSSWMELSIGVSLLLPGMIAAALVLIDTCEWFETGQADTVPFREALVLGYYWLLVQVPCGSLGSYYGFSLKPIDSPVRKNRLQRDEVKVDDCPSCV